MIERAIRSAFGRERDPLFVEALAEDPEQAAAQIQAAHGRAAADRMADAMAGLFGMQ